MDKFPIGIEFFNSQEIYFSLGENVEFLPNFLRSTPFSQ